MWKSPVHRWICSTIQEDLLSIISSEHPAWLRTLGQPLRGWPNSISAMLRYGGFQKIVVPSNHPKLDDFFVLWSLVLGVPHSKNPQMFQDSPRLVNTSGRHKKLRSSCWKDGRAPWLSRVNFQWVCPLQTTQFGVINYPPWWKLSYGQ